MQDKRKRRFNWGSALGWLIFILMVGGGTLFKQLGRVLQGVVTLPANIVPYLIAGLVGLSMVVSVVRSISRATVQRGETRLPTGAPGRPNVPMPPFGQPNSAAPRLPASQLPQAMRVPSERAQPYGPGESRLPSTPRFDPIINPGVMLAGVVGLVIIGALAVMVLGLAWL